MRKFNPARLLLPLALLCALASSALAQTTPVDIRGALSTFPDSQAVLFVNAQRVVNDVMPKVVSPADYQKMLADAKKVGFDVRGLQFAAVGIRFKDDAPAGTPPEFVLVIRGNFNADSMLMLGKITLAARNLQSRTETYGSKSIEIIDAEAVSKSMGKSGGTGEGTGADGEAPKPKPFPYPEIAVAALDSNTLVTGVPAFVRAAVDASGGQGTLRPSLLSLAAEDSDAIWSLTAELPPNLADMAHKYGVPANSQFDQMVGWVKQLNISQGMTAADFTLGVAVTTDQPEHASAFSGLVRMGQAFADNLLREALAKSKGKDAVRARQGLAMLASAVNRTEGNKLILRVSVPQQTIFDMVKEQTEKGKKPARTTTRRRTRRR
ncbi:MAG TPA: hypothetical protein VM914_06835 [Pyrinomonadaceae bacterium]|jgi:hypothetical protein|nr:hypothetical protein [Pyrinomonadaceae bacterium]